MPRGVEECMNCKNDIRTHTHIRVSRFADGFEGVWLKACIDIVGVHLDHVTLTFRGEHGSHDTNWQTQD